MSVSDTKKLDAAHHRWQRKILKISWKDMITNKTLCERTGQDTMELIIRERWLRWFGHAYRMDSYRIARQAMDWIPPDFKKKGCLRVSWTSTIKKVLDLLGLTWNEALDLMKDCSEWRGCTARHASLLLQCEEGLRSKVYTDGTWHSCWLSLLIERCFVYTGYR